MRTASLDQSVAVPLRSLASSPVTLARWQLFERAGRLVGPHASPTRTAAVLVKLPDRCCNTRTAAVANVSSTQMLTSKLSFLFFAGFTACLLSHVCFDSRPVRVRVAVLLGVCVVVLLEFTELAKPVEMPCLCCNTRSRCCVSVVAHTIQWQSKEDRSRLQNGWRSEEPSNTLPRAPPAGCHALDKHGPRAAAARSNTKARLRCARARQPQRRAARPQTPPSAAARRSPPPRRSYVYSAKHIGAAHGQRIRGMGRAGQYKQGPRGGENEAHVADKTRSGRGRARPGAAR